MVVYLGQVHPDGGALGPAVGGPLSFPQGRDSGTAHCAIGHQLGSPPMAFYGMKQVPTGSRDRLRYALAVDGMPVGVVQLSHSGHVWFEVDGRGRSWVTLHQATRALAADRRR